MDTDRKGRGFTLIELLAVVAVVLLLLSLLVPALGGAKHRAQRLVCSKNMESLSKAWTLYRAENEGRPVGSNTYDINVDWAGPYNTLDAIRNGRLFPFVKEPRIYRCTTPQLDYYRSYSINGYLNGEYLPYAPSSVGMSGTVRPVKTILFAEECDRRSYLMNSFLATTTVWVDFLAGNHRDGDNFTFVDGHAEFRKYESSNTLSVGYAYAAATHYVNDAGNPDLLWLGNALNPNL